MSFTMNRRKLFINAGSATFSSLLSKSDAGAFTFRDVLQGLAVSIFPGAAVALAGFGLVQSVSLVSNANKLVKQTKRLGIHVDQVLNDVSNTLSDIRIFIQDCDRILLEIEALIKQLPDEFVAAFDAAATKSALGDLKADSANMTGYLNSKGSIVTNQSRIQDLCEKIVKDISQIDAHNGNMFDFVIQAVPALTVWMQGYTAYNLLLDGHQRAVNPWDHQLVSTIALPKFNGVIQSIRDQKKDSGEIASNIPLEQKVIYTFDGKKFRKTDKQFLAIYSAGMIDDGFYYTIWPTGADWQAPSFMVGPGNSGPPKGSVPQAGDLCFLTSGSERFWFRPPDQSINYSAPFAAGTAPLGWPPPDSVAAQRAAAAFPRLLTNALKTAVAFNQLTDGWQIFEKSKEVYLVTGNRDLWSSVPKLKV